MFENLKFKSAMKKLNSGQEIGLKELDDMFSDLMGRPDLQKNLLEHKTSQQILQQINVETNNAVVRQNFDLSIARTADFRKALVSNKNISLETYENYLQLHEMKLVSNPTIDDKYYEKLEHNSDIHQAISRKYFEKIKPMLETDVLNLTKIDVHKLRGSQLNEAKEIIVDKLIRLGLKANIEQFDLYREQQNFKTEKYQQLIKNYQENAKLTDRNVYVQFSADGIYQTISNGFNEVLSHETVSIQVENVSNEDKQFSLNQEDVPWNLQDKYKNGKLYGVTEEDIDEIPEYLRESVKKALIKKNENTKKEEPTLDDVDLDNIEDCLSDDLET